ILVQVADPLGIPLYCLEESLPLLCSLDFPFEVRDVRNRRKPPGAVDLARQTVQKRRLLCLPAAAVRRSQVDRYRTDTELAAEALDRQAEVVPSNRILQRSPFMAIHLYRAI